MAFDAAMFEREPVLDIPAMLRYRKYKDVWGNVEVTMRCRLAKRLRFFTPWFCAVIAPSPRTVTFPLHYESPPKVL